MRIKKEERNGNQTRPKTVKQINLATNEDFKAMNFWMQDLKRDFGTAPDEKQEPKLSLCECREDIDYWTMKTFIVNNFKNIIHVRENISTFLYHELSKYLTTFYSKSTIIKSTLSIY